MSVKQTSAAELRRKAKERLAESKLKPSEDLHDSDVRAMFHELQVHQIELEMQNAELLAAEAATSEAMCKYADLFDFAPIGYFLWNDEGMICEVNLAGAALLGLDRSTVMNRPFGHFVVPEDRSTFADFCQRTMRADAKQTCEVRMLGDVRRIHVLIEGIAASDQGGKIRFCRAAVIDISEQVRQRELVREQEATLHGLLDVVDDSVLVFDLEGTILACNPIAAQRFGKTPKSMIGHSIYGFLPPEIAQSRKLRVQEAAVSGRRVHFEDQRAGMWFENTVYPVFDNNRKTLHFVVLSRDISEKKRSAVELQETCDRLALAANAAQIGMFDWNVRTGETAWTQQHEVIFGYPANTATTSQHPYRDWAERVHRDDLPRVEEVIRHCIEERTLYQVEYRVVWPDGSHHWVAGQGRAYYDTDGHVTRMLGTVMDITERKRAGEALRDREAEYRQLVDLSLDGIFVVDEDRLAFVNPAGLSLLGASRPEQVPGQRVLTFIHPEDQPAVVERMREMYTNHQTSSWMEQRVVRLDDGIVTVEAAAVPFVHLGRSASQVIVRDISDRRRAEEEKLELERRLLHAQKLESLGVLAGGIAHDFNNVLAGILGYADLARLHLAEREPALADIEVIKDSVQRAADLTRQMLAYSGKGKFIVESVSLSQVVEDNRKMLAMSVSKKVTLDYHLAPDLPATQADASQIQQILLNLVINASEAIGEQNGIIRVSTDTIHCSEVDCATLHGENAMREGTYVRLKVADTGCGMNRETLSKIFDPFFTTKFTGRGLGLAAVHGIVRGHKGSMRVVSTPGEGTTFELLLPSSGAAPIAVGKSISTKPWRGSGTVLVVDDDDVVRDLASRMLGHMGFVALTAKDGDEAIRLYELRQKDIACVLLDLTMPKMNGAETFRELHRISPDIRVVLSSGYGEEDAIGHFSQLGLAGFIQKPYQFDKMVATIRAALGGGSAEGTPAVIPCPVATSQRSESATSAEWQPWLGTVLVVDDDKTNRKSMQVIFKHAGFSTLAAEDGEEAIRVFQEHQDQCVCVFLDLNLPKMSGEDVFRELRRICPRVRVIVTSGHPAEFLERRLAGLEVFAFVCKPGSPDDAIAKLRESILKKDRDPCNTRTFR